MRALMGATLESWRAGELESGGVVRGSVHPQRLKDAEMASKLLHD